MPPIAAVPTAPPLASLPPLHEGGLTDALRAVIGLPDARHADLRALASAPEPLPCATCLDGTLNLALAAETFTAALVAMAGAVAPGGLVVFDVDTAARHAWRLDETWVYEDAKTYICWEGKGADEADARLGWCDVYAFADEGPAWRRTDHRIARRRWTDDDVHAAAAAAGLEVVTRLGQGARGALHAACDDARHHQAVHVLRRPPR